MHVPLNSSVTWGQNVFAGVGGLPCDRFGWWLAPHNSPRGGAWAANNKSLVGAWQCHCVPWIAVIHWPPLARGGGWAMGWQAPTTRGRRAGRQRPQAQHSPRSRGMAVAPTQSGVASHCLWGTPALQKLLQCCEGFLLLFTQGFNPLRTAKNNTRDVTLWTSLVLITRL